jgi:Tfp pilus assembly protein PilF
LQRGLAHHQAREYEQARLIYKRVLATDPKHFDALHLLGVIAAQSGEPELAVDLIGQAIKVK